MRDKGVEGRRLVILGDGHLDAHFGKTALGVLRYRPDDVVAVIDQGMAGRTAGQALGCGGDTPIVATLQEALARRPDALLIGVAPRGGQIPHAWHPLLVQAIEAGLDIISGLHQFVSEDPDLSKLARERGVQLVDVRKPPSRLAVAEATPHREGSTVVTLVGSDCAVGKMSVALDIEREARERGMDVQFVATGQTGMMIAGTGIPLDRIIGDFMSGAVEEAVNSAAQDHDVILVEGRGSLIHPAYSGVTLALIHGSRPDALILTVMPARVRIEEYDVEIPPVLELIEMHESAAGWIKQAPVIGIALNGFGLSDDEVRRAIEHIVVETALPATDTFRFGAGPLVDAVQSFHLRRTEQ